MTREEKQYEIYRYAFCDSYFLDKLKTNWNEIYRILSFKGFDLDVLPLFYIDSLYKWCKER